MRELKSAWMVMVRPALTFGTAILLASTITESLRAQATTSPPPPPGTRTHTLPSGGRYEAGGLKKWLFGGDYRDVWTTPITVPVLNLDSVGGGLTPLRTGGFGQSISLHFEGRDGKRYVVRSVDKDPSRRLVDDLKGTVVQSVLQDQISSLHPTAALVVDGLLEATGILHSPHTLVVIPDDPRLGEFREQFAGMLGMLVLHPNEGPENSPGFAGSAQISGSEGFLERLERTACDRVDSRAFLKARLVDFVVGDKDRHAGQWRWASFTEGECRVWLPIPEDRDQAFIHFDGLMMAFVRRSRPQQIQFKKDYPSVDGLTFNGWEVDRQLLVDLDKPVWDSVATVVERELTDAVIEEAVRRMPPEHYALTGERVAEALKGRRDALAEFATKYYRRISKWVDVETTDEAEHIELAHRENGALDVRVALREASGPLAAGHVHFARTFLPSETKEVRLYLHGGTDRAVVRGSSGKIKVRVIGGGGDDEFVNESDAGGGSPRFYDARGDNTFVTGRGARVSERSYECPPSKDQAHQYALDWGGNTVNLPFVSFSPDLGVYFGTNFTIERYGFRKYPYTSKHTFGVGFATQDQGFTAGYHGVFRDIARNVDFDVEVAYSGIEITRFHGFGNETVIPASSSFFKVDQTQLRLAPGISIRPHQTVRLFIAPVLKYSDTDLRDNEDQFIAIAPPYGTGTFGQLGGEASVELDTRDVPANARSGVHINVGGSVFPEVWDVDSTFGEIHAEGSTYLSPPLVLRPTLALRVGGKKVWGGFPYQEAAYLGGGRDLRGFYDRRFAGDASVYGSAEARVTFGRMSLLLFPATVGGFGFADAGRVYYDDDPSDADELHTGFGGGVWFSVISPANTITIAVADGDDLTGVYVRAGFVF